ncbi:MAG: aspartate 1-decarboxylase [Planctomycetota bacterium]|nr:aspartate 1-decarboxylase [Planctomycetota bacterium]
MQVTVLRTKIHGAQVTRAEVSYEGSLTLDADLFDRAGFVPNEKVIVANITNGERFETYVIRGSAGPREVGLNGGAARLGTVGDQLIVLAFTQMPEEAARDFSPTVIRSADL